MEMNHNLIETLMRRDGLSRIEAEQEVEECRQDLMDRLEKGDMPFDIMEEWFGLEPDYLDDIMY